MIQLRPYQQDCYDGVFLQWQSVTNVLLALPTGGGKTVILSKIVQDLQGVTFVLVHRKELVGQISTTLAKFEVKHIIIADKKVIGDTVKTHIVETGKNWCTPVSKVVVASVDSLITDKNQATYAHLIAQCSTWIIDEAHHVIRENKWGRCAALFPNAKGLGVTATPVRGDGKGLGSHADGLFDAIVLGPTMRWLIDNGYLCEYEIYVPDNDLDEKLLKISKATGDWTDNSAAKAIKESSIVGDAVDKYCELAYGKQGIAFVPSVEIAVMLADKFKARGIRAEAISAKTPPADRSKMMRQFANREIKYLINVDLFAEGLDVPGIEVVSMLRPTQSFSLYAQQFGRALRIAEGKLKAIIIDHVGNCLNPVLGLPDDTRRVWTLDAREKRSSTKADDVIPLQKCPSCTRPYEKIYKACPYDDCGHVIEPTERSAPKFVDGDLTMLDPSTLAMMRGQVAKVDESPSDLESRMRYAGAPEIAIRSAVKNHKARYESINTLRAAIVNWTGRQRAAGITEESTIHRIFFHKFKTTSVEAQAMPSKDALKLAEKINES